VQQVAIRWGVVAGGLLACGVVTVCMPSGRVAKAPGSNPGPTQERGAKATVPQGRIVAHTTRMPPQRYDDRLRADLFTAPQPAPKVVPPASRPAPESPPPPQVVVPPPPDPLAGYVFTGVMRVGDQRSALVENAKTKEGYFLKEGDSFAGGVVTQITEQMLTVTVDGAPHTLARNDHYSFVPLDKSASFVPGGGGSNASGGVQRLSVMLSATDTFTTAFAAEAQVIEASNWSNAAQSYESAVPIVLGGLREINSEERW
jgi:hypothetical protein